jgi:hypothetical protein
LASFWLVCLGLTAVPSLAGSAIITPRALSRVATLFDRHRLIESLEEEINDEKENGTAAELPSTFEGFSVSHRLGSPMITLQSEADGDKCDCGCPMACSSTQWNL